MRIRITGLLAILALFGCVFAKAEPPKSAKKIYLLADTEHQQWCAFSSEATWKSEVKSLSSMRVTTVDYVDGRVTTIRVTEEDETGDWIVYDHYSLDESGMLRKLKRTINVLPGDRSEEQVFLIQGEKSRKQSSTSRTLSTGKPISPSKDWLPEVPIVTSLHVFPFSPLLDAEKLDEIRSKGKACVRVDRP